MCSHGVWCSNGTAAVAYAAGLVGPLYVNGGFCWAGNASQLARTPTAVSLLDYGTVNVSVSCSVALQYNGCSSGKYLNNTGSCVHCPVPSETCASALCTASNTAAPVCVECQDNYFLSPITGNCSRCTESIEGCNVTAECAEYSDAFCLQCSSGYYWSDGSCDSCASEMDGCTECSSESVCTSCGPGYSLVSGSCVACADLYSVCANCSSPECQVCPVGSQLSGGQCVPSFESQSGASGGALAGGIVGGLLGVCAVIGAVFGFYRYKSARGGQQPATGPYSVLSESGGGKKIPIGLADAQDGWNPMYVDPETVPASAATTAGPGAIPMMPVFNSSTEV